MLIALIAVAVRRADLPRRPRRVRHPRPRQAGGPDEPRSAPRRLARSSRSRRSSSSCSRLLMWDKRLIAWTFVLALPRRGRPARHGDRRASLGRRPPPGERRRDPRDLGLPRPPGLGAQGRVRGGRLRMNRHSPAQRTSRQARRRAGTVGRVSTTVLLAAGPETSGPLVGAAARPRVRDRRARRPRRRRDRRRGRRGRAALRRRAGDPARRRRRRARRPGARLPARLRRLHPAAVPARGARRADPGRPPPPPDSRAAPPLRGRAAHRRGEPDRDARRRRRCGSRSGSSRCSRSSPASRRGCSRAPSCCAGSGTGRRDERPARSRRTPHACAASSVRSTPPRPGSTTSGAWATA